MPTYYAYVLLKEGWTFSGAVDRKNAAQLLPPYDSGDWGKVLRNFEACSR